MSKCKCGVFLASMAAASMGQCATCNAASRDARKAEKVDTEEELGRLRQLLKAESGEVLRLQEELEGMVSPMIEHSSSLWERLFVLALAEVPPGGGLVKGVQVARTTADLIMGHLRQQEGSGPSGQEVEEGEGPYAAAVRALKEHT